MVSPKAAGSELSQGGAHRGGCELGLEGGALPQPRPPGLPPSVWSRRATEHSWPSVTCGRGSSTCRGWMSPLRCVSPLLSPTSLLADGRSPRASCARWANGLMASASQGPVPANPIARAGRDGREQTRGSAGPHLHTRAGGSVRAKQSDRVITGDKHTHPRISCACL